MSKKTSRRKTSRGFEHHAIDPRDFVVFKPRRKPIPGVPTFETLPDRPEVLRKAETLEAAEKAIGEWQQGRSRYAAQGLHAAAAYGTGGVQPTVEEMMRDREVDPDAPSGADLAAAAAESLATMRLHNLAEREAMAETPSSWERRGLRVLSGRERAAAARELGIAATSPARFEEARVRWAAAQRKEPSFEAPTRPEMPILTDDERKLMAPEERAARVAALKAWDAATLKSRPEEPMYAPRPQTQADIGSKVDVRSGRAIRPESPAFRVAEQTTKEKYELLAQSEDEVDQALVQIGVADFIEAACTRIARIRDPQRRKHEFERVQDFRDRMHESWDPAHLEPYTEAEFAYALGAMLPGRKGTAGAFSEAVKTIGTKFEFDDEDGHHVIWLTDGADLVRTGVLSRYAGQRDLSGALKSAYKSARRARRDFTLRNVEAIEQVMSLVVTLGRRHQWFDQAVSKYLAASNRGRKALGTLRLDIFLAAAEFGFQIPKEVGPWPDPAILRDRAEMKARAMSDEPWSIFNEAGKAWQMPATGAESEAQAQLARERYEAFHEESSAWGPSSSKHEMRTKVAERAAIRGGQRAPSPAEQQAIRQGQTPREYRSPEEVAAGRAQAEAARLETLRKAAREIDEAIGKLTDKFRR
jgi:hypothetical protein